MKSLTRKQHLKEIQESKDYVKKFKGKSAEGFVRTPTGPRSMADEPGDIE